MLKKFDQLLNKKSSSSYTNGSKEMDSGSVFDFITLIKNWKDVVGDMLANNSIPLRINQGTLTIITKHSAISNELNFMSTMIKNNIVKAFPELGRSIDKIYFQNSPQIFEQMKQDELQYQAKKDKEKAMNHPYSPEYLNRMADAKEFYKDVLSDNENEKLDPELERLLLSLKIQKDRANPGKN